MPGTRVRPALLALVLAGCAAGGGGVFHGFSMTALYSVRQLGYVQSLGPVPVEVRGASFAGAPPDVFARVVAAAMSGANAGPPLVFTADPATGAQNYRVVLVFGAAAIGSSDLCQPRDPPIEPSGPAVRAQAAFCVEDRRITEISGRMASEAAGPDDPAFTAFLRGLTANLLPPRDAVEERRRRCVPGLLC
jgi:hypothetical protein